MTNNKAFEHLYGLYLYMHHHGILLREMADFEKEEWEKMGKDLEVLDILKPFLKRSLHIEKIDLTKEENKIYKGYLPKDYNKTYIYKWDYNYSVWNVLLDEENAIKLKEWLENDNTRNL